MNFKNLFFAALFLLVCNVTNAQCDAFYALSEGAKFELSHFDKKQKLTGVSKYEVTEVRTSGDGFEATVTAKFDDKDGEELNFHDFPVSCNSEGISVEFDFTNNPAFNNMGDNMEAVVEGDANVIPSNLSVGMPLPDANTSVDMMLNGTKIMGMNVKQFNRKVVAQEMITTPAGTFECFKITADHELKMLMKKKNSTIEWYAKGVGMVRSETYNKKGKMIAHSELTSFTAGE